MDWDEGDADVDFSLSGGPAKRPAPAPRFRPKVKGKVKTEPADAPAAPASASVAIPASVKKQEKEEEEAEPEVEAKPPAVASSVPTVPKPEVELTAMESEPPMEADGEDGEEDAEEEDVVVREIDVFRSASPIDEDTELYIMQYVLRPSWRPYEFNERCEEVRLKPKESKLEIDLSIDVDSENYNNGVADALPLEKQTLCSSRTPLSTSYAVGILKGNQLHLNPVHAIVQFRPSMAHINTRLKKIIQNAQSVELGKTANQNAGASTGKPATVSSNEKVNDEPWIKLEYHGVDSHLTERYHNKMVSENNVQIPFLMKPSDYINSLCPSTFAGNKTKLPSRRFLLSLPLEERLKMWLSKNSQVNRFQALTHLAPGISEEDLLKTLPLYADLVQGLWVCKSSLLYEGKEAAIRDYILYEFSLKPTSKLERLKGLNGRTKTDLLKPLAVQRSTFEDWKFKEPADLTFIKEHADIVKQQEVSWSDRSKTFQAYRSGNVPKSSAYGAKDKPKTKVVSSLPNETREYLKKALLMIFQEKRTHSMNSVIQALRQLAISYSARPKDDPKTKALINAATVGSSDHGVSDLECILSDIAVKVHGVYVLRSTGNEALDQLRGVIISLLQGKEINGKINKQEICIAVQTTLKKDISDKEYKQILPEICVFSKGSWVLKSGDEK